jgi:hypothetical protein
MHSGVSVGQFLNATLFEKAVNTVQIHDLFVAQAIAKYIF